METLSEKIYAVLYQDIIDGVLTPGQRLTLKELKERFDTSHTPIREALTRLSEKGLVSYYSNRGVTVVEMTKNEVQRLYQLVSELDALAVKFCSLAFSPEPLLHELRRLMEASEEYLSAGDLKNWDKCSDEFHTAFYRYAENPFLDESAERLRARIDLLTANSIRTEDRARAINRDHAEIYEAVAAGDFPLAEQRMRLHVQRDMAVVLNEGLFHAG